MNCAKAFRLPLIALVAAFITGVPASASDLAWTVTTTDSWTTSNQGSFADVFTVNGSSSVAVTKLGIPVVPDNVNSGMYSTSLQVSIFDSNGNLLTGVDLNPGQVSSSGGYYWKTIGTLVLSAGQTYTIAVNNNGSVPAYASSNTPPFTTSGWATFDSAEFVSGDASTNHMSINPGAGNTVDNTFFDLNLQGSPSAVPEPESLLLLGSGLISMAGFLRLRRRKQ
jgi:hypothetical protein